MWDALSYSGASTSINMVVCTAFALFGTELAVLMAPTVISRHGCRFTRSAMAPRLQLQRLWLVARSLLFICALINSLFMLAIMTTYNLPLTTLWDAHSARAIILVITTCLLTSLTLTHTHRGHFHRKLGALGKSDSKEQEAAAVASLISGQSGGVVEALQKAIRIFVVLPLKNLSAADLSTNTDTGLNMKVNHAALGECSTFMSHSWCMCLRLPVRLQAR
jgi:hypothetical protein